MDKKNEPKSLLRLIADYLKECRERVLNSMAERMFRATNKQLKLADGKHIYYMNMVRFRYGTEKVKPCEMIFANPIDALLHKHACDENDAWEWVATVSIMSATELTVTNYREKLLDEDYQRLLAAARSDQDESVFVDTESKKLAFYQYEHS